MWGGFPWFKAASAIRPRYTTGYAVYASAQLPPTPAFGTGMVPAGAVGHVGAENGIVQASYALPVQGLGGLINGNLIQQPLMRG